MAESTVDTEILLALLLSMVNNPNLSQENLLGALADAGGNVEDAAAILNKPKSSSHARTSLSSRKRKRNTNLDNWIVNKKADNEKVKPGIIGEPIDIDSLADTSYTELPLAEEKDQLLEKGTEVSTNKIVKPTVPLLSILKQAPLSSKAIPKPLPRTLGTPDLVSRYTPCTIHSSILPSDLAYRLFYAMLKEATGWSRNKWWLFDRVVESPHRTSFYARDLARDDPGEMQEAARYWYNGRPTDPPKTFLPEMEEACEIIEKVVNEQILRRGKFYPMEWPISSEHPWKANVAASNCYTGSKESVGYHSDQLTYLGPCPTIASLSLGTTRTFRLREVIPQQEKEERNAQTFNIPVTHNSLLIMHASCQERFKHAVPSQQTIDAFKPQFPPPLTGSHPGGNSEPNEISQEDSLEMMPPTTSRINITFRFYRPDFRPTSVPRCHCGIPTILRPNMKRRTRENALDDHNITDDGVSSICEDVVGMKYFWMCYAGTQNDGKGCSFFQLLDLEKEGRKRMTTVI